MFIEYMVTDAVIGEAQDPFFDHLASALDRLAEKGIELEVVERDEKDTHVRVSWLDHRSGSAIRMWDDYVAQVRYLELRAPDQAQLSQLRTILSEEIQPPSRGELLQRAQGRQPEPSALMKLAYGAGDDPDAKTVSTITGALSAASAPVREAAARAAGILGWKQFVPALQAQKDAETDPSVAQMVAKSLDMCSADPRAAPRR